MPVLSSPPLEPPYLTAEEIEAFAPYPLPPAPAGQRGRLRKRLAEAGCYEPGQIGGRRWPIGCVSLEVTQRCNLDCSLCYLSEHSEAVRDIPLEELFRRIDVIQAHYGEHTDIQVSGGEPTLRRREDLIRIVRRISEKGMRASLFTNGIRATRELLSALSEAPYGRRFAGLFPAPGRHRPGHPARARGVHHPRYGGAPDPGGGRSPPAVRHAPGRAPALQPLWHGLRDQRCSLRFL